LHTAEMYDQLKVLQEEGCEVVIISRRWNASASV